MSSPLWLLDRSRVVDGRGFCPRARLLNYHIGPNGYGIQMKATKIPLMTGTGAHDGLKPILEWVQQFNQLPPDPVVREGVQVATAQYMKVVTARGFAYLQDDENVAYVLREQQYLIEGLIWAWTLEVLPEILQRGRIIEVEVDDVYVFGCTCGLSDGVGTKADHEARDCEGLGLMCKPDFLVETHLTKELEYHEFKTTGMDSMTFRDKWEVMIQMFAATLDAERRHGKHVQSIYIHGLVKGKRQGDYNPASGKYDGPQRQQSVFCYGYKKPANPPMEQEQWAALYEYFDQFEQRTKRLPKAYQKTGVWELPDHFLQHANTVPAGTPLPGKAEFWAKWIPQEARRKNLVLIGPFSRQSQMVEHFLQECQGEEQRWREGLWRLYDLGQQILVESGDAERMYTPEGWWLWVWPDPRFQALLDQTFPRSYECRRYGARNRCQFEGPCLIREGWADPIGSGLFIERRPHHQAELEQAIGRGLLPPEEGLGEEFEAEF